MQKSHWVPLLLLSQLSDLSINHFHPFFLFLYPQVQECDAEDQEFGGYALAFAAGKLKPEVKTLQLATDRLLVVIFACV